MLSLQDVDISFGSNTVVHGADLILENTEIDCLLGASGCGKTSLLRAIAGFQPISQGTITLQGQVIASSSFQVPPEQRNIGMVFQDYALFPHLTVGDNIAFGLHRQTTLSQQQRIKELLDLVQLPGYQHRYPHELSGGQQQRVALARALAPKPKLLLLDEPFGSQDSELREQLAKEVRSILKAENITALLVTHDQQEAFAMADKIGVMQQGKIMQWASAYQIYHSPVNREVADFIGEGAFLKGSVISKTQVKTALGVIDGVIPNELAPGTAVELLIRPSDLKIDPDASVKARITKRVFRGAQYQYTLDLEEGYSVLMLAPSHQEFQIGSFVGVRLDVQHLIVFQEIF